ncbi:MAG: N-acetyltransferase [Oscillospiraceae bacterium]|nr:N-acetyltransferase [Oscillospiraceae bacterium]
MVEIQKVTTKRQKRIFVNFVLDMYKGNPNAVPKLYIDEMNIFNEKVNPAYEFCDVVQFLAYESDRCVGRIAGIYHRKSNEKWNENAVRFTRFDFIDDISVSTALLDAVEVWGRALGANRVIGPIGFTDFDQQGMQLEGFEYPCNYITLHNFEYYISHMNELGYDKEVDWVEYRLEILSEKQEMLYKLADRVQRRLNVRLMEFTRMSKLNKYLPKIMDLVNEAYKDLHGVVELTDRQISQYINQLKLVLNPEYVKLIFDSSDELIGFGFGMPSFNKALQKSNGHLFPFGWLRILLTSRKKGGVLDLYLVGVKDNYRTKGLPAILLAAMQKTAKKNNVLYAETGPELEDNKQVQSLWKYFNSTQHIKRRCWKKSLI